MITSTSQSAQDAMHGITPRSISQKYLPKDRQQDTDESLADMMAGLHPHEDHSEEDKT